MGKQIQFFREFNFTEEQQLIKQTAAAFAKNDLLPGVIERDEKQQFPKEQIATMGVLEF